MPYVRVTAQLVHTAPRPGVRKQRSQLNTTDIHLLKHVQGEVQRLLVVLLADGALLIAAASRWDEACWLCYACRALF